MVQTLPGTAEVFAEDELDAATAIPRNKTSESNLTEAFKIFPSRNKGPLSLY
jgi:hypothetical protein